LKNLIFDDTSCHGLTGRQLLLHYERINQTLES